MTREALIDLVRRMESTGRRLANAWWGVHCEISNAGRIADLLEGLRDAGNCACEWFDLGEEVRAALGTGEAGGHVCTADRVYGPGPAKWVPASSAAALADIERTVLETPFADGTHTGAKQADLKRRIVERLRAAWNAKGHCSYVWAFGDPPYICPRDAGHEGDHHCAPAPPPIPEGQPRCAEGYHDVETCRHEVWQIPTPSPEGQPGEQSDVAHVLEVRSELVGGPATHGALPPVLPGSVAPVACPECGQTDWWGQEGANVDQCGHCGGRAPPSPGERASTCPRCSHWVDWTSGTPSCLRVDCDCECDHNPRERVDAVDASAEPVDENAERRQVEHERLRERAEAAEAEHDELVEKLGLAKATEAMLNTQYDRLKKGTEALIAHLNAIEAAARRVAESNPHHATDANDEAHNALRRALGMEPRAW